MKDKDREIELYKLQTKYFLIALGIVFLPIILITIAMVF
jgi:hypothetical protein